MRLQMFDRFFRRDSAEDTVNEQRTMALTQTYLAHELKLVQIAQERKEA